MNEMVKLAGHSLYDVLPNHQVQGSLSYPRLFTFPYLIFKIMRRIFVVMELSEANS